MDDIGQAGVYFNSEGYRLLGTLFLGRGDNPKPTAILLHGVPGFEKNYDLALHLRENDWNSMIFHYRGSWGSQGVYSLDTLPLDVQAAVDFLEGCKFPQIDSGEIFIIGHSLGGWAAVLSAASDSRIRAICVYGAVTDPESLVFPHSYVAEEFTPWLQGISPFEFVRQWKSLGPEFSPIHRVGELDSRPLLIIHSLNDDVVPFSQAESLHQRAGHSCQLISHPTGGHCFVWHRSWLIATIFDWLNQNR